MNRPNQLQTIQEIVNRAISAAEPNWSELMIVYHVEEGQSQFGNTYLATVDGQTREKWLPPTNDMDEWLRKLRAELSQNGTAMFTSCKLHVCADGRFNASYGYEPLDWDALTEDEEWNFPSVTSLH